MVYDKCNSSGEFYTVKSNTLTSASTYHKWGDEKMKSIEIIPRIRIDGVYHTLEELPKEQVRKIIEEKIDLAMSGMNFERIKSA